ncbi:MAG: family 16 glycosylhydrolase [Flavobacteriales bacterium]
MKWVIYSLTSFLSIIALASSCQKEEVLPDAMLPSNLNFTASHISGDVTVNASAQSANFYTVIFYDTDDTVFVQTETGVATYTYALSGTYKITVRANLTEMDYIESSKNVTIYVDQNVTGAPSTGYSTPSSYPGYTLVWSDEFNGTTVSSDWTFDIGTGNSGWGNNELQYYTDQNVTVAGGFLEIKAKSETFNSQEYTSTRMKTQGLNSWKYGRIDIRAALPYGKGIWPALWMLGDNISSVGWPSCGEIDIVEMIGGEGLNDRTIHGTAHWNQSGHSQYGNSYSLPSGKFADEFHVFSIIWDATSIKWLMDDVQYNQLDITPAELSEFQNNFFLIFNVAVGGNWPGNPDATTVFPQSMYVDYVRVFQ